MNDATAGCPFCGTPLQLLDRAISARCMICGERGRARTWCTKGHFVCGPCAGSETMALLHELLRQPLSDDPVELFLRLRAAGDNPMHGPCHHALVVAAFLLAYHHRHGEPSWSAIVDVLQTASDQLPGGTCGFWGCCAAGLGIGMAYCAILDSAPTSGPERAAAHQVVAEITRRIGEVRAPRCCRRECLIALQVACELSETLLPQALASTHRVVCEQAAENDECIREACPFF